MIKVDNGYPLQKVKLAFLMLPTNGTIVTKSQQVSSSRKIAWKMFAWNHDFDKPVHLSGLISAFYTCKADVCLHPQLTQVTSARSDQAVQRHRLIRFVHVGFLCQHVFWHMNSVQYPDYFVWPQPGQQKCCYFWWFSETMCAKSDMTEEKNGIAHQEWNLTLNNVVAI